jgi:hypothetical protein
MPSAGSLRYRVEQCADLWPFGKVAAAEVTAKHLAVIAQAADRVHDVAGHRATVSAGNFWGWVMSLVQEAVVKVRGVVAAMLQGIAGCRSRRTDRQ